MKILVKFFVFDLPPGFADAELDLAEGATVADVLDAGLELMRQRQVMLEVDELKTPTVMGNNIWSDPNESVSDGDTLSIIRPMDGG